MRSKVWYFASSLFLILFWNTLAHADCTFNNLQFTRERSGKTISASPSVSQCASIPSSITLDAFNFYSALTLIQVVYVSGPANIQVNGSSTRAGSVIASAFIHDLKTITFNVAGDYTLQGRGSLGPTAATASIVVKISQFGLSPGQLDIATGGVAPNTNMFTVTTGLTGQIKFSTQLVRNEGSDSLSALSINNQASPNKGIVAASSNGSSGAFQVTALNSIFKSNVANVTVPPQPLIQVIVGEAQGQNDLAQSAVAVVIRNRIRSTLRFNENRKTYGGEVTAPGQFASTSTSRFINAALRSSAQSQAAYDSALRNAAAVFDLRQGATLGGALAFGSPGALPSAQRQAELSKLQNALNQCQRVSANSLAFDRRWFPVLSGDVQAMIVNGIAADVFVFVRPRPANGCAVLSVPFQ